MNVGRQTWWTLCLCSILPFATSAARGLERLVFEPAETKVEFELGATLHTVQGTASLKPSMLEFDRIGKTCSGRVSIDARSLKTGNARRDRAMHTKVLESDEYPEIAFVCESFEGEVDDGEIVVSGQFEIHGQVHSTQMDLSVRSEPDALRVNSTFDVPYVLWGLKDPSKPLLRVKKSVRIRFDAKADLIEEADQPEP